MGLLRVGIAVLGVLLTLWVYSIFAPAIMEPMHDTVNGSDAVQGEGYSGDVDNILELVVKDAPTLMMGGFIVLFIAFAVWRERFESRRRF